MCFCLFVWGRTRVFVFICLCTSLIVYVCVCVRARVGVCVCVYVHVRVLYRSLWEGLCHPPIWFDQDISDTFCFWIRTNSQENEAITLYVGIRVNQHINEEIKAAYLFHRPTWQQSWSWLRNPIPFLCSPISAAYWCSPLLFTAQCVIHLFSNSFRCQARVLECIRTLSLHRILNRTQRNKGSWEGYQTPLECF